MANKNKAPIRQMMYEGKILTKIWHKFFDKVSTTIDLSEDSESHIALGTYDTRIDILDKKFEELEQIIQSLPSSKNYDSQIKELEALIVSGIFNPNQKEDMDVFTSLGKYPLMKEITFNNDSGPITVFTVTGDVFVNILPVCKTNLASAAGANIRLGTESSTDAMIVDTVAEDIDANKMWVDQSPTTEIESTERIRGYFITNGNNVILTLDAQIDSGVIRFYGWWSPLPYSEGANVV